LRHVYYLLIYFSSEYIDHAKIEPTALPTTN